MSESNNKSIRFATILAMVFLALGIGVLWLIKKALEIEGDAAFLALLFGPLVIYLAISGKLKDFSILGVSANFIEEKVENIKDEIVGASEYENERNTYFSKLRQVLEKENKFCLIYADVDDLRKISRKIYDEERKGEAKSSIHHLTTNRGGSKSTTAPTRMDVKRRLEKEIRGDIIEKLLFSLTDAFYDEKDYDGKYDVFLLEEPDLVMITRAIALEQAKSVATKGLKYFKKHYNYGATIGITFREEFPERPSPRDIDKVALRRLTYGKNKEKGKVYDIGSI